MHRTILSLSLTLILLCGCSRKPDISGLYRTDSAEWDFRSDGTAFYKEVESQNVVGEMLTTEVSATGKWKHSGNRIVFTGTKIISANFESTDNPPKTFPAISTFSVEGNGDLVLIPSESDTRKAERYSKQK
jgi:hypothetical protein